MAMSPRYVQYLLKQGDLLNRILAFNADFSARQYRQRAETQPESIKDSLYVVHPELARFHEEHNISYYFENNTDRLCLMKQSELETLLVYLGACINSQSLASVTLQSEKDQIYEQIGRDAYNFALDYGYLIKNVDFALNLDSLKQDCTYLGLCAIKCIEPLFSSQELREYFIEMLLTFTKQHDLNPNIITSREHVLSIIYPVNENIKAPSPSRMNNPAQFNTWENSTQMAAARDFIGDYQRQTNNKVVKGLASLIHANGNASQSSDQDQDLDTPQADATASPQSDAANAGDAANASDAVNAANAGNAAVNNDQSSASDATATAATNPSATEADAQSPLAGQDSTTAAAASDTAIAPASAATNPASATSNSSSSNPNESAHAAPQTSTLSDAAQAAQQNATDASATQATPATSEQAAVSSNANAASAAESNAVSTAGNAVSAEGNAAPSATSTNANASASAATANASAPAAPSAPATNAKGGIDYSIVPEGVGAPLEVGYTDAALYGSYIDKRKFRAASLKQRKDQQSILRGQRQEPQIVEEQQLITLEFGAHQVFDLTAVILKFQIDEHWHEYLQE